MLRSAIFLSLAIAFAVPAAAEAPLAKGSFEGQTFEYASRLGANDAVVIEGRFIRGDRFRFTVKPSGHVSGEVGETPVTFVVSKKQYAKLAQKLRPAEVAQAPAAFSAGTN